MILIVCMVNSNMLLYVTVKSGLPEGKRSLPHDEKKIEETPLQAVISKFEILQAKSKTVRDRVYLDGVLAVLDSFIDREIEYAKQVRKETIDIVHSLKKEIDHSHDTPKKPKNVKRKSRTENYNQALEDIIKALNELE